MLDRKLNVWWTGLTVLFSSFLVYCYMAFRKPRPIGDDINFSEQSIEVDEISGERKSKIYESSDPLMHLFEDALTLQQLIVRGSKHTVDGKCLGAVNKKQNCIDWLTYAQVLDRIKQFGDGLIQLGLSSENNAFLGIYANNCVDYVIAEYACYEHSLTVVPLYDTLGPKAVSHIINQVGIRVILCDKEDRFHGIVSQANCMTSLRYIILATDIPQSYKSKALSFGIKVLTVKEVEELGRQKPSDCLPAQPDNLAVICYTSGTTDVPKGVILTHKNIVANICSVMFQLGKHAPNKLDTILSYLPLAHMFERCCQAAVFMVGGKVVIFGGDIKGLSEDMKIVRPTILPVVPRILTRIYDTCYSNIKGNKLKEWLLKKALSSKQSEVERRIIRTNSIWDKIVFKKIREGLGGRVRLMVCGSAPLSNNVLDFMRCAMGCVIVEGYGQTECVAPCTLTIPGDYQSGHVGPPLPCCSIKLVDIPDMKYFVKEGKGEICVKGPTVFKGYFKNPINTSVALDNDGWLKTGDIGQWNQNGTIRIIDRKKHIFKLSQGEYIAPEKIENVYSKSNFVAQIFVYGESLKSCLVAVVVPEVTVLTIWCRKNNIRGTLTDLCQNKDVKKAILNDLISLAKKEGLLSFELLKDIYLHPDAFTIDNGLLTPTLKSKRLEIKNYFVRQLEEMYRTLN